jgi:hypothetical protein
VSRQSFAYFLIVFYLTLGCLAPFETELETQGGQIIIAGQLSTLPQRSVVSIGVASSEKELPKPVSGALVKLMRSNGIAGYFSEDFNKPGTYKSAGLSGIPGVSYYLEVLLPNNSVYRSAIEKLPEAASQGTANYRVINKDVTSLEGGILQLPFVEIRSKLTLAGSSRFIKAEVEEVYMLSPTDFPDISGLIPPPCFITQNADPQTIPLYDGSSSVSDTLTLIAGSRVVDNTFLEKHYFTVYTSHLTKEAFEYWRKVNILANQVGSIFDTPPAKIYGNIINAETGTETHGYFQAVNESYDRFVMFKQDLPFPLLVEECTFRGYDVNYATRCLNCLTVRNSSYERPEWF